jgi:hypothetical protein
MKHGEKTPEINRADVFLAVDAIAVRLMELSSQAEDNGLR